jgi:hypothetical protein
MRRQREMVIRLTMFEIGKTLKDSTAEFDRTVQYVEDTIAALKDLDRTASRFVVEQGFIAQIRRTPLGVTLVMGPFNYPLNETFTTLIPALIMGNPVVFKTPKLGVLLYEPLLEAFRDAFPPGVVNIVTGQGSEIVGPIMESGKVDVLAFIGSSKVANTLQKQHPRPARLRSILGLDAKNPAIVLPDADLDVAVRECLTGALSFNGQRCTAIKLIFVERTIADDFVARRRRNLEAPRRHALGGRRRTDAATRARQARISFRLHRRRGTPQSTGPCRQPRRRRGGSHLVRAGAALSRLAGDAHLPRGAVQFWKDLSLPFYGYNRQGATISEGVRESFWLQGMMAGLPASYFCIKAFSENRSDRGSQGLRRADVGPAWRRRPDRPHRRFRPAVLEADQERDPQGLRGSPAWHVHHAEGQGERGTARLHQGVSRTRA